MEHITLDVHGYDTSFTRVSNTDKVSLASYNLTKPVGCNSYFNYEFVYSLTMCGRANGQVYMALRVCINKVYEETKRKRQKYM